MARKPSDLVKHGIRCMCKESPFWYAITLLDLYVLPVGSAFSVFWCLFLDFPDSWNIQCGWQCPTLYFVNTTQWKDFRFCLVNLVKIDDFLNLCLMFDVLHDRGTRQTLNVSDMSEHMSLANMSLNFLKIGANLLWSLRPRVYDNNVRTDVKLQ